MKEIPNIDSVPLYNQGGKVIAYVPRDKIAWYNVNIPIGSDGILRVGEAQYLGCPICVFDRMCIQWAEYEQIPRISPCRV